MWTDIIIHTRNGISITSHGKTRRYDYSPERCRALCAILIALGAHYHGPQNYQWAWQLKRAPRPPSKPKPKRRKR